MCRIILLITSINIKKYIDHSYGLCYDTNKLLHKNKQIKRSLKHLNNLIITDRNFDGDSVTAPGIFYMLLASPMLRQKREARTYQY